MEVAETNRQFDEYELVSESNGARHASDINELKGRRGGRNQGERGETGRIYTPQGGVTMESVARVLCLLLQ